MKKGTSFQPGSHGFVFNLNHFVIGSKLVSLHFIQMLSKILVHKPLIIILYTIISETDFTTHFIGIIMILSLFKMIHSCFNQQCHNKYEIQRTTMDVIIN